MKAGWEIRPLGDVCAFRRGLTYKKGDEVDANGTAVLRATNINLATGALDLSEIRYIDREIAVPRTKMVESGTLLICTASGSKKHLGKTALITEEMDFAFGGFMGLLVPTKAVLPEYLQSLMRSDEYWAFIDGLSDGANINNLKFDQLGDFPVPLPPLEEQKRIVAILDEVSEGLDRARANAEANLRDAEELFASALHRIFLPENGPWDVKPLSELGIIQTGSTPKTSETGNSGSYIPFIKPGDFRPDGSLVYDNEGLSEQGASVSRIVPAGSALMVCIGATIGKTGHSDRPITTNQQINAISPKDGISGQYLYYQMLTPEFQAAVLHRSGQATLPIINKSKWSALTVKLPVARDRQTPIVEQLSGLREQLVVATAALESKLTSLGSLRQSLLQRAFAGELT